MEEVKKKVCSVCKEELGIENFKDNYRNKDKKASVCYKCKEVRVGIYKIIAPSGRIYIGQSIDINSRFNQYKKLQNCKEQTLLYKSLNEYSVDNHIFEVIEDCFMEDLNCRERYWQDFYDVLGEKGLNCILQECGEQRKVLSDETRSKLGQKGEKNYFFGKSGELSPWYGVRGESHPNYGRDAWNKGKEMHHLRGKNSPFYGKSRSEDIKNKISKNRIDNEVAKGSKNPRARKVIDTLTLEIFDTIEDACKKFNIVRTTFNRYMNGDLENTTTLILLDNYTEGMKIEPYKRMYGNSKKVIDITTLKIFDSATEASILLGYNRGTFSDKLRGLYKNNTNCMYLSEYELLNPDFKND